MLTDQPDRNTIATDTSRTLFVDAGAGTGKTYALIHRLLHLVLEDGVPLTRIAAVTFTERAGAELRDRLRAALEERLRETPAHETALRLRLHTALADLDLAAIGTLHSFARRILSEHPIEAGIPPTFQVLDEVASSVAFDERWAAIQVDLLEDDVVADALIFGLANGVSLKRLRSLCRVLESNWDLVEERVADLPATGTFTPPPVEDVLVDYRRLLARRAECSDSSDKLKLRLDELDARVAAVASAPDAATTFACLALVSKAGPGRVGSAKNWTDKQAVVADFNAVNQRAAQAVVSATDRVLQVLTGWLARRVVRDANARAAEGRLEFHDLLVKARDLLRRDSTVRSGLQHKYCRILLDEFQDTDPIQIEIAGRICGGAGADAVRWQDIDIPEGSLFVVGDPKQSIYRFRRASIELYHSARHRFDPARQHPSLTTSFRSVAPIVEWVNCVFSELMAVEARNQASFAALATARDVELVGDAVTVLGAEEHTDAPTADELRRREAADVAAAITDALQKKWSVHPPDCPEGRPLRHSDIAILLPARTSLLPLHRALDSAGIPYQTDANSLVYQESDVRDLLMCARAIADPTDSLALVTTLRSPLFGCGDDDLWQWRWNGGGVQRGFSISASDDESQGPVADALRALRRLRDETRWSTPSEILARIVADRRMFELAAVLPRSRDAWRRLRFVIDQARAWSESSSGGLRAYLAWAARQGQETSRVAEAVLPETDLDAVRIMTIHAAKGLEFSMVVLSGMTTRPRSVAGVDVLWPAAGGIAVSVGKNIQTVQYAVESPIDEQLDSHERVRLLYVAASRARDHLVVSLHRSGNGKSAASVLANSTAARRGVEVFAPVSAPVFRPDASSTPSRTVMDAEVFQRRVAVARAATRKSWTTAASGLEGTEPEVVLGPMLDPGSHKGPRSLDLPPWSKGRFGSEIGRAVHGVLQTVDLLTGSGMDEAVAAQALSEGIVGHEQLIGELVRSALATPTIRAAAQLEHWRETYVGAELEPGRVTEGYLDLLIRETSGSLTVVDYKTDAVPAGGMKSRVVFYRPQLRAYRDALVAATDAKVRCILMFLRPGESAIEVEVGFEQEDDDD